MKANKTIKTVKNNILNIKLKNYKLDRLHIELKPSTVKKVLGISIIIISLIVFFYNTVWFYINNSPIVVWAEKWPFVIAHLFFSAIGLVVLANADKS